MTTQEMLDTLMYSIRSDGNAEIVGSPRPVPHGGMAVDVREYNGKFFVVQCYQVYGTSEVLASAEAILMDENLSVDVKSRYMTVMRFGAKGKRLAGVASIKAFPMEEDCIGHMRSLEQKTKHFGYFSNYALMDEEGQFLFMSDVKKY